MLRWLQAARWSDGVLLDLPSPLLVNRVMERRQIRDLIAHVAGPGFQPCRGADGTGGLVHRCRFRPDSDLGNRRGGQVCVIARFAEGLVADLSLLWFGFERADLALDDAVSLVAVLAEQADLQLDVFKPAPLDSVQGPT